MAECKFIVSKVLWRVAGLLGASGLEPGPAAFKSLPAHRAPALVVWNGSETCTKPTLQARPLKHLQAPRCGLLAVSKQSSSGLEWSVLSECLRARWIESGRGEGPLEGTAPAHRV